MSPMFPHSMMGNSLLTTQQGSEQHIKCPQVDAMGIFTDKIILPQVGKMFTYASIFKRLINHQSLLYLLSERTCRFIKCC